MLYITRIKDYKDFKKQFSNAKMRPLRSLLKSHNFMWRLRTTIKEEGFRKKFDFPACSVVNDMICDCDMTMKTLMEFLSVVDPENDYVFRYDKYRFHNKEYVVDEFNGLCQDGDMERFRYVHKLKDGYERNNLKMRPAKLLGKVLASGIPLFWANVPESYKNHFVERFAEEFKAYARNMLDDIELHYDDDIERIYNSSNFADDIESCMNDKGICEEFYGDVVKAKAAYLTNKEGKILARCIVFPEVFVDGIDKTYRLAERQYAVSNNNDMYKQMLVNKLYEAGLIDGHKTVGAGCNDTTDFVDKDGRELHRCSSLYIVCKPRYDPMEDDNRVPYMDSFKWMEEGSGVVFLNNNGDCREWIAVLNSTDGCLELIKWDSYHDRYTENDVVDVIDEYGERRTCDETYLDDFRQVDDEWYHESLVGICPTCDAYFLIKDGVHSEVTGNQYCCHECMVEDENRVRKAFEDAQKHEGENYDSYHERYTRLATVNVVVPSWPGSRHNDVLTCDSTRLEDFVLLGDRYYHKDAYVMCDGYCGRYYPASQLVYDSTLDKLFCGNDCHEAAKEVFYKNMNCNELIEEIV